MNASDPFRLTEAEIDGLLDEDLRYGDLTTRLSGIAGKSGRIIFLARDDLILSGVDEAVRILVRLGAQVTCAAAAGCNAPSGTLLLQAEGKAGELHVGWKVCQTLMEWSSGVASATGRIVAAARAVAPQVRVVCTRKSVPFTRKLALKAVLVGGGEAHRLGLSGSIMLFPEHRAFLDVPEDLKAAIANLRQRAPEQSVMVEVNAVAEALAAAAALADVVQLERFTPDQVRAVLRGIVKRIDGRPVIAAAGGINASNAAEYAAAGADVLVTSAPYYARPTDIQVKFQPA
jgi:molybdenum transport protein